MKFEVRLTNQRKVKWLLLYLLALSCLGALGGVVATKLGLNPFLTAGLMVMMLLLLMGALWLFGQLEEAIREPVCLTILPDRLVELWERTGTVKIWEFQQLRAYHYQASNRTGTFLLLTFRDGRRVKWLTGYAGFSFKNADAFALMVKAFEKTWQEYQKTNLTLR